MTTADAGRTTGSGYGAPPASDCDPRTIVRLRCQTAALEVRAAYNRDHEEALAAAQTQYDAARKAYTTAAKAALPLVVAAGAVLDDVFDKLRCRLDDEQEQAVEAAGQRIADRLAKTLPRRGCALTTRCDFEA